MKAARWLALAGSTAAVVALGVVSTQPANAYLYTRNGYTYADTSYRNNVSGSYVKTVSRYDKAQGVLYIKAWAKDTKCDNERAAAMAHAWSNTKHKWVFYSNGATPTGCSTGWQIGTESIPVDRLGATSVIIKDGIYGKTYGPNYVRIWSR